MSKEKPVIGTEGIYDARTLGAPRMLVLGIQHMFAMFGATVLVPVLTGLSVTTTLLFAGLGTLLFHLLAKGKVPAFLGSSFAFLAGYQAIAPNKEPELLPYACAGVAVAGLLYVILAALFRAFGAQKVMRFFPPIVTGPVIICIGLTLSSSALNNCAKNWPIALVAIVVVIVCNIWGKGMIKIIPILLGVVASYVVAAITGNVDFTLVEKAAWIGSPVEMERTVFALFGDCDTSLLVSSMITTWPTPACTAPCWVTAWQPPWLPCSALPPTPPMAKTPASWLCPASMTPASSASPLAWLSCSPSPLSSALWSPLCLWLPWAA